VDELHSLLRRKYRLFSPHMNSPANRIWTISNALSMMRVVLVLPVVLAILERNEMEVFAWGIVASLTDFFDGYLARKFDQVTEAGKIIDPLADKILAGAAALAMVSIGALPVWFVVVVIARDVVIFTAGMYVKLRLHIVLMSNMLGKWTLVSIVLVLITALFDLSGSLGWLHSALEILATGMMGASLVSYGKALKDAIKIKK
jgi:CDP-diacylglycerol--glycerol-3-phosphate 3-phosphatidyltransferase